ncbi:hypothetical protein [Rhodocista pekingensis]|uniref:Uncharacterized protein n=1 Tax=Rhodocista pekingensis TaxID=201185 RepID=A0ABW2KVU9_9PROT
MMLQLQIYLAAHLLFAVGLLVAAVVRLRQPQAGLVEWGNDALLIGALFTLAIVAVPFLG